MAKEKKVEKEAMAAPQVLVLPFPVQGHINPMLQFSKRLAARGIQVSLATTVFLAANMHADQLAPVRLCTISDGYDRGGFLEATSADAYHRRLDDVGPRTLADLLIASPAFTCLVYDTSLHWALGVARHLGLTAAAFSTQSSAAFSVYHHVYEGSLLLPYGDEAVKMPGLTTMTASDLPSLVFEEGAYQPILKLKLKQFSNLDDADFVIINTIQDLEDEVN